MKTNKAVFLIIIVCLSITVLCCFSYASSGNGYLSPDPGESFCVSGKAGSFDPAARSFTIESDTGSFAIIVPDDHKIIIDGHLGCFENIKMIAEYKNITVSAFGSEHDVLYIQTMPRSYESRLDDLCKEGAYYVLSLKINGLNTFFCVETAGFPENIKIGDTIEFIPDGCRIIEVKKK